MPPSPALRALWLSACISGVSSWGAGMEVPQPREGSGGACSQLERATDPICQVTAQPRAPAGAFPRWSDGSLLNFVSWAPGKPRPINKDKKCVYMTASRGEGPDLAVLGLWSDWRPLAEQRHPYPSAAGGVMPGLSLPAEDWGDQKCLTALPYICKRSNGTAVKPSLPPLPAPASGGCPRGWFPFLSKVWRGRKGDGRLLVPHQPRQGRGRVLRNGGLGRNACTGFGGNAGGCMHGDAGEVRRGVRVQEKVGG